MSDITDHGRRVISDCAGRYGLSEAAVEHMARAVANGGGSMAQFNVPELGGSGQWMYGGMTMVGDMFNTGLQSRVSNLCGELSDAMARGAFFAAPKGTGAMGGGSWWPDGLGSPASVGGQNSARYAYFPDARRIAFDAGNGGPVILLDTLNNNIGGFSQQQSGPGDPFQGVSFSSQFGQFALSSLPRADGSGSGPAPVAQSSPEPDFAPQSEPDLPPQPASAPSQSGGAPSGDADAILATIARLAALRDAGAVSDEEFASKKSELLARL